MLIEFFQYKGKSRKKLLNLVLEKYHLNTNLDSIYQQSQLFLFKDLIYQYLIFNTELDLKKLAEYYFANKDYFYPSIQDQALISIVLRWETDIGIALLQEIHNRREIDGKNINWSHNGVIYDLRAWNKLFLSPYSMIANQYHFIDLDTETYIENYLNLDFIPLNILAFNQYKKFENLSLNNAKIKNAHFVWPEISNIVFNVLYIDRSLIMGINLKKATYAKKLLLKKSILFQGSLVSPTDSMNNVSIHFEKPNMIHLIKNSLFGKKNILFSDLEVAQGTNIESKELYDFYNWYSYYVSNNRGKNKVIAFFDLIFTKYYTSMFMVLLWSIIFIILYAFIMFKLDQYGTYFIFSEKVSKVFSTYLFMSMSNFTTLGFGEIVANGWLSYLIVGLEVLTGYYMLAMLVAIASKREMKYS